MGRDTAAIKLFPTILFNVRWILLFKYHVDYVSNPDTIRERMDKRQ